MSSRKVTPRGLIQGVLDTNSVSKSATNTSRSCRRRSLRTSLSGATPGTLIKGVLKTSSTAKKSPAQRSRVIATPPRSVRRSTRISGLQSIAQDPTPRGLIQGYLASTAPETPAVRAVFESTPDVSREQDVERENYPGRVVDLISPDVDTPEVLSQGLRRSARAGRKRQRYTVDSVKDTFQSGVHQRIQKGVTDLPEFSDSSAIASPTLQSIPEEVEGGHIPPVAEAANTSTDEDERSDVQEDDEIAAMAQLATQPQGVQTAKPESVHEPVEGTEASVQETSAISLSQTSIGEVAAANTVQIHQNSQMESAFQGDSQSDRGATQSDQGGLQNDKGGSQSDQEEDGSKSAKRQKVMDADSFRTEGRSQRVQEQMSVKEVEREEQSVERKSQEGNMLTASPASVAAYLEQSTDSSAVDFLTANEESDVSGIYSPLNTPNELSKAKRNTPPAKTPAVLRREKENSAPATSRAVHRAPGRRNPSRRQHVLPLSLTKSIFTHFCRGRVSRDAWDAIEDCSEAFFEQLSKDLAHYSKHAKRKTIRQEDVILLMKRQGQVSDQQSLHHLIEKYLSMEYRQELIPCAQPGGGAKPSP